MTSPIGSGIVGLPEWTGARQSGFSRYCAMIHVRKLGKRYGPKVLFTGVSLQLNPGQRYGLVGANGSGKTTFLKILTGHESADEGEVALGRQLRLGFLRQDQFSEDAARIVDVAMRGDPEVFTALHELQHGEAGADLDPERVAEHSELIAARDGYTLEARAREILVGVGIPAGVLDRPLGTLSGGFKLRVLLAQVLAGRPDVLLLDEPTNHLDILSIRFLEQFLRDYAGTAVIISHDRRFLDAVSTRVLDVDYETVIDYPGNYSAFLAAKEERAAQKKLEVERAEKLVAEKKAFVERFRAKATKARQAQSRAKQIEKIEIEEVKQSSRHAPGFRFAVDQKTGLDVLQVRELYKAYGQNQVLAKVSFAVRRGERVGIIGPNGIGKSTLLKIVTGNLAADRGDTNLGANVQIGYFAQDHRDLLNDPNLTPLDFVWNAVPAETSAAVRGQLGRMLLSGDEVEKKVTALSGGEAARLVFARLAASRPNVLVLDEPTNHLDLESIDALALALERYEGTLLFVSHDRWFVSRVATRIIELLPDGYRDFPGTFGEYLERDGSDHLDVQTAWAAEKKQRAGATGAGQAGLPSAGVGASSSGSANSGNANSGSASSGAGAGVDLDPKERRRLANRRKSLPKKRDEVLAQIEQLEESKRVIHARFADPEFYTKTSSSEQDELGRTAQDLETQIAAALSEWEAIETELAAPS